MAHTVELLPDDGLADGVRQLWKRLAAAGLPSLAHHQHPTNRPHLTLATVDELDLAALERLDAALHVLPLPARLESLATFPGRGGVLYWAVAPSLELLALQRQVIAALDPAPPRPAYWTAHCTLARRLTPQQLGAALEILAGWQPVDGGWVAARTYDTVARTVRAVPDAG